MLNFRNTNIIFIALLMISTALVLVGKISFFVYPLLLVLYSGVVFYGCYFVQSNFFLPVICSADTDEKVIAISFDDGPIGDCTVELLGLLKTYDVQAAFFCIGKHIAANEKIFRQIHQEGHVIGNHSYSHHFWFDLFPAKKMLADLKMMDNEMERLTGLKPKLFRPPYGVTNPNVKRAVNAGGYIPVGWNVRSMDTVTGDETTLLKKVTRPLNPGDIFLFHDHGKATRAILPVFIRYVKESGYELVRLDKMLNLKPYA